MTDWCGICGDKATWHCEICGAKGKARNAYVPHLRTHEPGELVEAVDPAVGWYMRSSHAARIPFDGDE